MMQSHTSVSDYPVAINSADNLRSAAAVVAGAGLVIADYIVPGISRVAKPALGLDK